MRVQDIQRAFETLTPTSSGVSLDEEPAPRRLDLHGVLEMRVEHRCPKCGYYAILTPSIDVVKMWCYEKRKKPVAKQVVFTAEKDGVVEL